MAIPTLVFVEVEFEDLGDEADFDTEDVGGHFGDGEGVGEDAVADLGLVEALVGFEEAVAGEIPGEGEIGGMRSRHAFSLAGVGIH